ncbi:MAG: hypothetical protein EBU88_20360, partial [Acidobacteria bacterium]|nr:hypothetical protein [Acidobacteriota bacterium]
VRPPQLGPNIAQLSWTLENPLSNSTTYCLGFTYDNPESISGFSSNTWTLNQPKYNSYVGIGSDGTLAITVNDKYLHNSFWYNTPMSVDRNFTVNFVYNAPAQYAYGNGVTFCLQNDSRGTSAVGDDGSGLGYTGISKSVAYELNLYQGQGEVLGTTFRTDGKAQSYTSTSPVSINSGHNIQVTLRYDAAAQTITETLTDLSSPTTTYTKTYTGIDIQATVGGASAYMGFTGSTYGDSSQESQQNISQFSLTYDVSETVQLWVDGVQAGTITPGTETYLGYQIPFTVNSAGVHQLQFRGVPSVTNQTLALTPVAFLDAVAIVPSSSVIANASFESPAVSAG